MPLLYVCSKYKGQKTSCLKHNRKANIYVSKGEVSRDSEYALLPNILWHAGVFHDTLYHSGPFRLDDFHRSWMLWGIS